MPVRIGASYVSEAAAEFAKARQKEREDTEAAKKKDGVLSELQGKFSGLKFSIGTKPFSGMGTNNVAISPKILKQMEQDPEKRLEYEALLYDVSNTDLVKGRNLKSAGWIIDDKGGLSAWSISGQDSKNQSSVKRSDKKNWWQEILPKAKKKKSSMKELQEKRQEKQREKEESELLLHRQTEAELMLRGHAGRGVEAAYQGNPSLSKAYLQHGKALGESKAFGSTKEFYGYLQEKFTVAREGIASISSKYLRACLTDEEKRLKLFENLRAADEMLESRKGEVGFQGMRVSIDEDGEMTVESSKSTVTINEGKSMRQIADAATKGDMQAVLARLQQDLQEVEDGLKQNMCDEAEVEKAKKLIEQAKQRMAKLPDRAPTPEEQNAMAVNMLI